MTVEQDRPRHVVLFSILRWHTTISHTVTGATWEAARPSQLREHVGPCQFYPRSTVDSELRTLSNNSLVTKVKVNGVNIGYAITEQGLSLIEDIGIPEHFDH
jgi:DNA-binding HxlR family transcriptional regulator